MLLLLLVPLTVNRYPGGRFFNLFNMGGAPDSQSMFEMKLKEIKNGRLAMLAWLGFMVQACTTHKGPVQNLLVGVGWFSC
jgi:hypothetical protein